MAKRKRGEEKLEKLKDEYRALAKELADIGFIWQGSITRQLLTCGNPNCACHSDRTRRHGPYIYWSTKVAGKSVSRLLTEEEVPFYQEWIGNRKRFDEIKRKLLKLSKRAAALILPARTSKRKAGRRAKGVSKEGT